MRYFVYKDAQIMGPFTREDLSQVQGMSGDSLVCPEASLGTRDSEWRPAAEAEGLAGLFEPRAALAAAPSIEGAAHGGLFPESVRGLVTEGFGYSGEWVSGAFEDPQFFRDWGALVDSATASTEEIARAQARATVLEQEVSELERKLERYDRQQNEILDRLNEKDRALTEKDRLLDQLQSRLPDLERALRATQDELLRARERFSAAAAAPAPLAPPPAATPEPPAAAAPVAGPAAPAPAEELAPTPAPEPQPSSPEPILLSSLSGEGEAPESGLPEIPEIAPRALQAAPEPSAPALEPEVAAPAAGEPSSLFTPIFDLNEPEPPAPVAQVAPVEPAAPAEPAALAEPAASAPVSSTVRLDLPPVESLPSALLQVEGVPFVPPLPPGLAFASPAVGPAVEEAKPALDLSAPPAEESASAEPVFFSPRPAEPPATFVEGRPAEATEGGPLVDLAGAAPSFGPEAGVAAEPSPAGPPPEVWGLSSATPAPVVRGPAFEEPPRTAIRSLDAPARPATPPASEPLQAGAVPAAPADAAPAPAGPVLPVGDRTAALASGAETRRRRHSRTFLLALGGAFVGLIVAGGFFLKDPKEVVLLFTMGPRKPATVDPDQLMGGVPASLSQVHPLPALARPAPSAAPAVAAAPVAPSGSPASSSAPAAAIPAAPAPSAAAPAAAPGRDFIADTSLQAIDFAKKYRLSGGRRTVAEWLQFSFLAPGNEEEWSAGAVEANVYLVSYRAFKGGRASKQEPITYLFEVDLQKKTMSGRNPAARELLAGVPKAARRTSKRSHARRAAPAADTFVGTNPDVEQLPLPDEPPAQPADAGSMAPDGGAAPADSGSTTPDAAAPPADAQAAPPSDSNPQLPGADLPPAP